MNTKELSENEEKKIEKIIQIVKDRPQKRGFFKKGTYKKYINFLKKQPCPKTFEKHHILPKHQGGTDDPSNMICIGKTQHILAHLLLFLENGNKGDLAAYIFRRCTKNMDITSQVKKARALDKLLKRGFFDSEFQRKNGFRGGKKGGLVNSSLQFAARSQVGQTYGRQTGVGNQSNLLKEKISLFHVWVHKDVPNLSITTQPANAVYEIAEELNFKCDELGLSDKKVNIQKVKKGGYFYSFIKGKKNSYFGWTIIKSFSTEFYDD
jgi:hypothetical protein